MEEDGARGEEQDEIPQDAIVVKPSSWAWRWSVLPWVIVAAVSVFVDQITFVGLPLALALIFIVPRYMSYRRTAYFLTDEHIIIQQGSTMGHQRHDLPISQVSAIRLSYGYFGRTLGYAAVHLADRDGRVAILPHVPLGSPLVEHLRTRLSPQPQGEENQGDPQVPEDDAESEAPPEPDN